QKLSRLVCGQLVLLDELIERVRNALQIGAAFTAIDRYVAGLRLHENRAARARRGRPGLRQCGADEGQRHKRGCKSARQAHHLSLLGLSSWVLMLISPVCEPTTQGDPGPVVWQSTPPLGLLASVAVALPGLLGVGSVATSPAGGDADCGAWAAYI